MIRAVVVDDHPLVRRGIVETLAEAFDIEVVAEADDGAEAIKAVRSLEGKADVVITDLTMPNVDGFELIGMLQAEWPTLPVLVLSTHTSTELGLHVLRAGAVGFVEKRAAPDVLVRAVRRVVFGGRYVGPDLAEHLAIVMTDPDEEILSVRELQVVRSIAQGKSRADTARTLAISPATVTTYKRRALRKLNLETESGLVRYALRRGWSE